MCTRETYVRLTLFLIWVMRAVVNSIFNCCLVKKYFPRKKWNLSGKYAPAIILFHEHDSFFFYQQKILLVHSLFGNGPLCTPSWHKLII